MGERSMLLTKRSNGLGNGRRRPQLYVAVFALGASVAAFIAVAPFGTKHPMQCGSPDTAKSISAAPLWLWSIGIASAVVAVALVSYARGVRSHRTSATAWLLWSSIATVATGIVAFAATHIVLGTCTT